MLSTGDSLSDNGNLFKATNGSIPSDAVYHSKGRFTGGLVWAEYLAIELGNVRATDIAVGGSHVNGGKAGGRAGFLALCSLRWGANSQHQKTSPLLPMDSCHCAHATATPDYQELIVGSRGVW